MNLNNSTISIWINSKAPHIVTRLHMNKITNGIWYKLEKSPINLKLEKKFDVLEIHVSRCQEYTELF